jgi:hypothetical protein
MSEDWFRVVKYLPPATRFQLEPSSSLVKPFSVRMLSSVAVV